MIQRHAEAVVLDSLRHFPVVLITGARQVGKSTLVQAICKNRWTADYLTLDDRNILDLAILDPDGLIGARAGSVAIDEVQKAPDLLRAIKLKVDRKRQAGQFLLTGSANILTLRSVSETLAGRIALHELYPFSFSEMFKRKKSSLILQHLFNAKTAEPLAKILKRRGTFPKKNWLEWILRGGYPDPVLSEKKSIRTRWFEAYRKTYIERDVRELQAIERLPDFGRLMALAVSRTGQLLNFSDLGRDAGLPYVTLRRYMNILEQTYQIFLVTPFFLNISKRLMKAPKLYGSDAGMACHLLGIYDVTSLQRNHKLGGLAETWVAGELKKIISLEAEPMNLYTWRLQSGQEIDFLIEKSNHFLAIEVKLGQQIERTVFSSFEILKKDLGDCLKMGVVLYGGEDIVVLGSQMIAIPYDVFFDSG